MSVFNEILQKINQTSNGFSESIKDDLKSALESLDKFTEEYLNGKSKGRDVSQKSVKTNLQSIHEDEDEPIKSEGKQIHSSTSSQSSSQESDKNQPDVVPRRRSKKRSKEEVDEMSSPEQDKRPKRNASVKAQGVISKQVNVNLSSKMRREEPSAPEVREGRRGRKKDTGSDKENSEPLIVKVKQEKISLPQEESMDSAPLSLDIDIKAERHTDEIAMPPPVAPLVKGRGRPAKKKETDKSDSQLVESSQDDESRRSTRTRKQTDNMPPPPTAGRSSRSTRASSRAVNTSTTNSNNTLNNVHDEMPPPLPETRPKRTRAKKKVSESTDTEKETAAVTPEKQRPKRTKRGQKAAEKESQKAEEKETPVQPQPPTISPKEERISEPQSDTSSPILSNKVVKSKAKAMTSTDTIDESNSKLNLEETRVLSRMNETVTISGESERNDLPNGKFDQVDGSSVKKGQMNETVVIESSSRNTMVLDKEPAPPMDTTVVIEKAPQANLTDDNSIMTDDNSDRETGTPPPLLRQHKQTPTSAVKEKVQQFEELASRVTRTKTRAMAKKEEPEENQTPPDKISKPILSADTLTKMNNLIFNGKPQSTISASASKPRTNIPVVKPAVPSSTSKLSNLAKHKEAEETLKREKEDARKKKEALLDAKKEAQKRKREDKMAAAAAARSAAERERQLAIEQAAREREEKQAHADQGKMYRMKEAERKKQEVARKAAETEERRRAEEKARLQRLADEQKRAELAKKRQGEEQEAMKKEAALMAKEIEKRQKEYIEKQKMKQRIEADKIHTPLQCQPPGGWPAPLDPVYMCDGFEQLNSDEDCDDEPQGRRPVPLWSTSKVRWQQLTVQSHIKQQHIDRLFSVRVHSPDLREIFPNIDRRALKRTSSAVWRTPPRPARLHAVAE